VIFSVLFAYEVIPKLQNKRKNEVSGVIKSLNYDNIYFVHNDSGDNSNLYAIKIDSSFTYDIAKIKLNIPHIDYEDISYLDKDTIILADMGNNKNKREDLAIYIFKEPNPKIDKKVVNIKKISLAYEDQFEFPPKKKYRNFDCEAIFSKNKKVYFLTKNKKNRKTNLYKLNSIKNSKGILKLISTFKIKGKVTGADNLDNMVAVLTYSGVWLFVGDNEDIFQNKIYHKKIKKSKKLKYEAISFINKKELMFITEAGKIFKIKLDSIMKNRLDYY
jgi:uncharacterized pyridoxamine 5'-phosphate oxidase family protein